MSTQSTFATIAVALLLLVAASGAEGASPKTASLSKPLKYSMSIEMLYDDQPVYPPGGPALRSTFTNNNNRLIRFNEMLLLFRYEVRYSPLNSPEGAAWKLVKPMNGPYGGDANGANKDVLGPGDTLIYHEYPINYAPSKIGFYRITVIMDSPDTEFVSAAGVKDKASRFDLVARSNTLTVERTNADFEVTPAPVPPGTAPIQTK